AALAPVIIVPAASIPAPRIPPPPGPALARHIPSDDDGRVRSAPPIVVVGQAGAAAGDLRVGRGGAAEHERARENEQQSTHALPPGRWDCAAGWRQPACRVAEDAEKSLSDVGL